MADVFISYKRAERPRVQLIADVLRADGSDVWFDARLGLGKGEGFDAEIEREVTSAACVLVCWTAEATKSIYVKAEAKKGLERDVLVPVFLEGCTLPVPFNAIDAADLAGWSGDITDERWIVVQAKVKETVERSKANYEHLAAHSRAEYDRVDDKLYPGTLELLSRRIAARSWQDASYYHNDVSALLGWIEDILEKEVGFNQAAYDEADRHSGGSWWHEWTNTYAPVRKAQLAGIREALHRIESAIVRSQEVFDRPSP